MTATLRIMPLLAFLGIALPTLTAAEKPETVSNPILGLLHNQGELPVGEMPPWAVVPNFGRLSGADGLDLVVGHLVRGKHVDARGRLRVYPNVGTATEPRYENGFWLDERIPSARIPHG